MNEFSYNNQQQQFLMKKASFDQRLGAFFLDYIIISFASFSIYIFVFVVPQIIFGLGETNLAIYSIVFMVLVFLVYAFRDVVGGQSVGKRIVGIGVRSISDNYSAPPASKLFLRQIFSFVWFIEFLVLITSKDKRKIGDKLAGTDVYNLREYNKLVQNAKRTEHAMLTQGSEHLTDSIPRPDTTTLQKSKKKKMAVIVVGALIVCALLVGAIALFVTSVFSLIESHPSYQIAIESITTNSEIETMIGEIERFSMTGGNASTGPGRGDANFNIRARGVYGDVRVFVELEMRDGGDWEIVWFNFVQIR